MKASRLAAGLVLVLGLAACGGSDKESAAPTMPDVVGHHLDDAKAEIKEAGFDDDVDVQGGGTFGIIDESNWSVCEQSPAAWKAIDRTPKISVDRGCDGGGDDESTKPTDTSPDTTASTESDEPADPTGIDAEAIEQAFVRHLTTPIQDMCTSAANDPTWTGGPHWACYYDGVEAQPGYLRVNLTTPGDYAPAELEEMANDVGRHWFNFIGCDFPNLDMIVVRINGLDHNVPRSSTNADQLC